MNNKNQLSDLFDKAYIPILVGITGHRDVENENELIIQIQKILEDICGKYQESPVVLLTPLAEGADRAAAKAVIELRKNNSLKINYLVILPMDETEYIYTFSNEESVLEYRELKNKAVGCYNIPVSESLDIDKIQDVEIRHSMLYTNMGNYIASSTQILIAAWNGAEEATKNKSKMNGESMLLDTVVKTDFLSERDICRNSEIKHGGTYHILRIRFFGIDDKYRSNESLFSNHEFGPVYWIKTKRKASDYLAEGDSLIGPVYPDFTVEYSKYELNFQNEETNSICKKLVTNFLCNQNKLLNKKNNINRTYEEILLKLNDYNSDIKKTYHKVIEEVEASNKDFISYSYIENNKSKSENYEFNDKENEFITQYSFANTISLHYQKKRKLEIALLIALVFVGLLSFNLYAGPLASSWFILAYSSIYLFGSLFCMFMIKSNNYHEKYIDYRGIAEGIRVQFFWGLIGIETSVFDKYLKKQKSSKIWIRVAVNNAYLLYKLSSEENKSSIRYEQNINIAYKLWLLNQYKYYNKKCPEKCRTDKLQKYIERTFFIVGLIIASLLAFLDTFEFITSGTCGINVMLLPCINKLDYQSIHKWMVFTIGFLPVIITSFKIFTELLAYSKLARNFKWMYMVYNIAIYEFERAKSKYGYDTEIFIKKCRKLFYDIGIEALLENEEWIVIFDERVPEMPK